MQVDRRRRARLLEAIGELQADPRGSLTGAERQNNRDRRAQGRRPGFEPAQDEAVVPKSVNCAFLGADLDLRLRRVEADTVVLFGVSTDMCVSTTARIASNS